MIMQLALASSAEFLFISSPQLETWWLHEDRKDTISWTASPSISPDDGHAWRRWDGHLFINRFKGSADLRSLQHEAVRR